MSSSGAKRQGSSKPERLLEFFRKKVDTSGPARDQREPDQRDLLRELEKIIESQKPTKLPPYISVSTQTEVFPEEPPPETKSSAVVDVDYRDYSTQTEEDPSHAETDAPPSCPTIPSRSPLRGSENEPETLKPATWEGSRHARSFRPHMRSKTPNHVFSFVVRNPLTNDNNPRDKPQAGMGSFKTIRQNEGPQLQEAIRLPHHDGFIRVRLPPTTFGPADSPVPQTRFLETNISARIDSRDSEKLMENDLEKDTRPATNHSTDSSRSSGEQRPVQSEVGTSRTQTFNPKLYDGATFRFSFHDQFSVQGEGNQSSR